MSMMTRDTSETSVAFSLAELAKLEQERVQQEDLQRARAREREAREQQEAAARRRSAEEARVAAAAEELSRARREEAEARARAEARVRVAGEVARIEAEAKARLDADNAERAHELAVLRTRTEGGRRRRGRTRSSRGSAAARAGTHRPGTAARSGSSRLAAGCPRASLENVVSERSSVGARRSASACAARRARSIGSPDIEPLVSSTRCTERCGREDGGVAVERSARRRWNAPPPGASAPRSSSGRSASALLVPSRISGA
jgi:membrane protein involved in colicin uptake